MTSFGIGLRYLRGRSVATGLSVLSIGFAVALVASLRSVPPALQAGALQPAREVPLVLARGNSPTRLILAAIMLEAPAPPELERATLERVRRAPGVVEAVPERILHTEDGPVVATTPTLFRVRRTLALAAGRLVRTGESTAAVVGSKVADARRLAPGGRTRFAGRDLVVVGVLRATGTLADSAAFIDLPNDAAPLSAILVVPSSVADAATLTTAADVTGLLVVDVERALRQVTRLSGAADAIVTWLSWALAAMMGLLVLATSYAGVRERARDLAVLRAIGARRSSLLVIVSTEALVTGIMGALLGLGLAGALLEVASAVLYDVGLVFKPRLSSDALWVGTAAVGVTLLASVIPALFAYRLDPARNLSGADRPWREVLTRRGRLRLAWFKLVLLLLLIVFVPSTIHRPSPPSRSLDGKSLRLFHQLEAWHGDGEAPAELAMLEGTTVTIEGFPYVPRDDGRRVFRSKLYLVAMDPNHPVELFHDSHEPDTADRIAVELTEPVEPTRYPLRVTGTFRLGRTTSALVVLEEARAKVIAVAGD